jgi:TonB family protein
VIALMVEAACRSLVLGVIVWFALVALRVRNPHIHKTVWLTVLLASLAMPLLMQRQIAPVMTAPPVTLTVISGSAPMLAAVSKWNVGGVITVLYALVTFGFLGRLATGCARVWHLRRCSKPVPASWEHSGEVLVSSKLSLPVTFGRTILLPAQAIEWTPAKRAVVLAHERAHVRHGDCFIQWLARLHVSVFWFNPMAWWLQRRLAALAETTSDDAVIAEFGDRAGYAEMLLDIASTPPAARADFEMTAAMASADVSDRIERIISETAPAPTPKWRYRALAVALLLPGIVGSAISVRMPVVSPLHLAQSTLRPDAAPENATEPAPATAGTHPGTGPESAAGGQPYIDAGFSVDMLERWYPARAKSAGIEGFVTIQVTLDAYGDATDTQVLTEDPLEHGFGAAASGLAHELKYVNPSGREASVTYNVKFELKKGTTPSIAGVPVAAYGG